MDELNTIIKAIIGNIRGCAVCDESSYQYIQQLAAIVEPLQNRFSTKFVTYVGKLAEYDSETIINDEEAQALIGIFEAQAIVEQHKTYETESDLSTFALDEDEKLELLRKCEQMRKIIWSSNVFDQPHRVRLLNRISAIETEVHKEKGMFDVILGGISDFGETAGKFGNDIKPLTDRMRDIASIARKKTPDYEQIPAPEEIAKLPPPEDDAED